MSSSRPLRLAPIQGVQAYVAVLRAVQRNAKLVLTATAFRGMAIAASQTILNLYLYSLGYDAAFIGLVSAVNSLAVLIVSLPTGYLADRVGRRIVLLIGGLIYPLSLLGLSLAPTTAGILLFDFVWGVVGTAYWVAGVPTLFASTRERERVHVFSVNSFLLWGIGPIGALVGGQVVEGAARLLGVSASSPGALRAGMLFIVLLGALGAVPYLFLHETRGLGPPPEPPPPAGQLTRLFVRLLLPDLVLAFGLGALLTFIQLYFHLRFGLDAGPVGAIIAVGGVIAGIGTLLTPLVSRHWGNLGSAVRLQWATVPLMAALALAMQLFIAIPVYWVLATLRGMSDPVYTAFVQERVPEVYRARLTGFYSVTYSIGFSLGPAAGGYLQKGGGFTAAFLMAAGVYLAGASLLYLFFGRSWNAAASQPELPLT